MRLDRQLARILAAVIVMIAAYLAPSAVQAHAGHHHPAPAAVVASEVLSPAAQTTTAATTVSSPRPRPFGPRPKRSMSWPALPTQAPGCHLRPAPARAAATPPWPAAPTRSPLI